jgi:hypothetical protein
MFEGVVCADAGTGLPVYGKELLGNVITGVTLEMIMLVVVDPP